MNGDTVSCLLQLAGSNGCQESFCPRCFLSRDTYEVSIEKGASVGKDEIQPEQRLLVFFKAFLSLFNRTAC